MPNDPSPADRPQPFVGRMRRPRKIKTPEQRLAQMVTHLEIAKALTMSPETLRRWVDEGLFRQPKLKIGTRWFYVESEVKRYLATGKWDKPGSKGGE
jgi:hypothetical protein